MKKHSAQFSPGLDLLYQDNCEANLNTIISKINLRMNKSTRKEEKIKRKD
jgi:hypothetical protein